MKYGQGGMNCQKGQALVVRDEDRIVNPLRVSNWTQEEVLVATRPESVVQVGRYNIPGAGRMRPSPERRRCSL